MWDLDGRDVPVTGQLHVLLLDNDELFDEWDDVYLLHYSHTIHVEGGHTGAERGTAAEPFRTVAKAAAYAWDGARLRIKAGLYPEPLSLSKRVRLLGEGGVVVIGKH